MVTVNNDLLKKAVLTARKTNYTNENYLYLKNVSIIEWDIKSAGLSVIKNKKLLPQDYIAKLEVMPKKERTVKEGLLQKKYPQLAESIIKTLEDVRENFVLSNQIYDSEILAIKKDAMFIINHLPENTTIFNDFVFRRKNEYTSYLALGKKEFYYSGHTDELDIKGIPSENIEKQKEYLIKDIKKFLKLGEINAGEDIFKLLKNYRQKYLKRELPVETYRELNTGMFRVGKYLIENVGEDMKSEIDISQNFVNYILPLIQAVL